MGVEALSSRAIIGAFYNRLEQNPGSKWIEKVSMLFQSDQASEEYKWLGMSPVMREWIGERMVKSLRDQGIEIKNKDFEATLELGRKELKRDKTGQALIRIMELADRTNSHWASLLSTLMINAESAVCYDGQYFFDTNHVEGDSGTQSNDIESDISELPVNQHGSTTAPSAEEMELSILDGVEQILSFKDDQGEPMNEGANEFLIMCPIPFMKSALAAINNPVLTSGRTNTIATSDFSIVPMVNPRLTWTTKFAVYRTDGLVKPFIRQEEEPVTLDAIAEGSELEFKTGKHQYGVKASRNVGYGYWQHACLVTLT